jgi:hypothetical protein
MALRTHSLVLRPKPGRQGQFCWAMFFLERMLTPHGTELATPAVEYTAAAPRLAAAIIPSKPSDTDLAYVGSMIAAQSTCIPAPRRPVLNWADDDETDNDDDMMEDVVAAPPNGRHQFAFETDPDCTACPTEYSASSAQAADDDASRKKAELRRMKNQRKRHARSIKRRKRAEEEGRRNKAVVQEELARVKKSLQAAVAAMKVAKKEVDQAMRTISGKKRKREQEGVGEMHGMNTKKKKRNRAPKKTAANSQS